MHIVQGRHNNDKHQVIDLLVCTRFEYNWVPRHGFINSLIGWISIYTLLQQPELSHVTERLKAFQLLCVFVYLDVHLII